MMIQASQREKVLIIATAGLLFVVVTFIVWRPMIRSWISTSTQQSLKTSELDRVHSTLARQQALERENQELIKSMNNPSGPSPVPDVLQKVELLARNNGVTIKSRTPQPPHDKGGFTEVAVECSMEASIDTLVKFLYDIKTAQDLLDIAELKISPTPASPGTLRADARIVSLRTSAR